ncbi:MAG: CLC_0170 family protein [Caulobacteraceae bacterium]
MLKIIIQNIKEFFDATVFITILCIGVFVIAVDYRYFRKIKYKKDAAITLAIGIVYLLLPFALLLISML